MVDRQGRRTYSLGETVSVPWGLDIVHGTVIGSYGSGRNERLVVRVEVPGSDDHPEVTFPVHAVAEAEASHENSADVGSWLRKIEYEREVGGVLAHFLSQRPNVERLFEASPIGTPVDFLIRSQDHRVFVEARNRLTTDLIRKIKDWSRRQPPLLPGAPLWVLVSQELPSELVLQAIDEANQKGTSVLAVRWSGEADTDDLESAIDEALAA